METKVEAWMAEGTRLLEQGRTEAGLARLTAAAELLLRGSVRVTGARAQAWATLAEQLLDQVERLQTGLPTLEPDSPLRLIRHTGVTFEDVAGLAEPKEILYKSLIRPALDPAAARRWRRPPGGAMLLYGPPGTGKSLFARAVAGELGVPFFEIKASTILSKWLSESERNVAQAFALLKQCPSCVLFIDEVETLLGSREDAHSTVNRVVSEFLSAMDGLAGRQPGLFILAATNYPEKIDPALRRSLRFGRPIPVGLPDAAAREAILRRQFDQVPCASGLDLASWARRGERYSGADLVALAREAVDRAWDREERTGQTTVLSDEDLEQAARVVQPTCTPADLERYARMAIGQ